MIAAVAVLCASCAGYGDREESVITTLADFEDDAVAITITDAVNAALSDCRAQFAKIPARGQRCLQIEIGAVQPNASAACDIRFRAATPFSRAERVGIYAWITQGSVSLQFRLRDGRGRLYETQPLALQVRNRWVRLHTDLTPENLKRVRAVTTGEGGGPEWPLEVAGLRVQAQGAGRQVVYVDDLEVEHRATGAGVLRGEFQFNEPTRIYSPGSLVRAGIVLENNSRINALPLNVTLRWRHSDGTEVARTDVFIQLPPSAADFRSRQPVDFSQVIGEPGLYHLTAEVRGALWATPAVYETTIAVTHPNRGLPRGRSGYFGVQSNLIREPAADQRLEIDIARDLGVQLLALETPWRSFEPRSGRYDFESLKELLGRLDRLDVAVMLMLTDPPEWVARDSESWWRAQSNFCTALAQGVGERLYGIRALAPTPGVLTEQDLQALAELNRRITAVRRNITLCAPPIRIEPGAPEHTRSPTLPGDSGFELSFETRGSADAARAGLAAFARQQGIRWGRNHRWFHYPEGRQGSGGVEDAVAMLHHYAEAAREGVGGVVWCELRDDTNDPRYPERMRGLVQRDFSPKSALIGFANVIGMLNGLLYAGSVPGAPEAYDSLLFLGGKRQVGVLCPKPNRILPAVIAPYQLTAGQLLVLDFDRRALPTTESEAPPLIETQPRPIFVSFMAEESQSAPQIGLARPWLEVPRTVYCDGETAFHIRLNAPLALRRSYLSLILPEGAPVKSSLSSRALRAAAGETLDFEVTITRTGEFEVPIGCHLRLSIEGRMLQIPIEIRPQAEVAGLSDGADLLCPEYAIGVLIETQGSGSGRTPAGYTIHAGFQDDALHVALELPPRSASPEFLTIGLAAANGDDPVKLRLENMTGSRGPSIVRSLDYARLEHWHWSIEEHASRRYCRVRIEPRGLGSASFRDAPRLMLSVRYEEAAPAAWARPRVLQWERGLVQNRSSTDQPRLTRGE